MKRDVSLYVSDILQNVDDVASYIAAMGFDEFTTDSRTSKAVIRSLEIIGEAAKQIPEDVRSLKPGVPWRDMARMRDKCIHFYFGVDYEILWLTVTESLPKIRNDIESLLHILRDK